MTDVMSKEQRRKNMQSIRSQSELENTVSKALWRKGLRFRKNVKNLFGKPDIVIKKYKIVIFIDSCFWHVCPIHGNMPKNNKDFWKKKLERNQERDMEVNKYYEESNWHIKRVWEHKIKQDFDETINEIFRFIISIKNEKIKGIHSS